MAPKDDGFEVEINALLTESAKWPEIRDSIMNARKAIDTLNLAPEAFGVPLLPDPGGQLPAAYTRLQDHLRDLLDAAATEFDELAGALQRAAFLYEESDEKAAKENTIYIFGS